MESELIIYQTDNGDTKIEVRLENENVWLTQSPMTELYQTTKQNISLHLKNIFKERELDKKLTVKEYLTVQQEGGHGNALMVVYDKGVVEIKQGKYLEVCNNTLPCIKIMYYGKSSKKEVS